MGAAPAHSRTLAPPDVTMPENFFATMSEGSGEPLLFGQERRRVLPRGFLPCRVRLIKGELVLGGALGGVESKHTLKVSRLAAGPQQQPPGIK